MMQLFTTGKEPRCVQTYLTPTEVRQRLGLSKIPGRFRLFTTGRWPEICDTSNAALIKRAFTLPKNTVIYAGGHGGEVVKGEASVALSEYFTTKKGAAKMLDKRGEAPR